MAIDPHTDGKAPVLPDGGVQKNQEPAVENADAAHLEKFGYKQELNRALGLFSSFGVQFTSISVASVTFTTLVVGFQLFGPASFWAFVIGGALQVFAVGLAVAQLVSAFPLSGGVYQIVNRLTTKPWLAWQSGWWLIIAHTVAVTAVGVGMVPFIASWFGYTDLSPTTTTLWALGLIAFVTIVNISGVRIAALLNNLGVFAEIAGIIVIIGALVFFKYDRAPSATLFDTGGTTTTAALWFAPFLFAMMLPAFTISSFDATGNAAEETKNAARNAPLGTVLANTSAYIVGIVFIYLLVRAIPNVDDVVASDTPVKLILDSSVGSTTTVIFEAMAILALIANMAMVQLTAVRVLWSQARDRQIPAARWFHKLNGNKIPINATLVVAGLSVLFAMWSSLLAVLAALTALAWALAYGVVVTVGLPAVLKKKLPPHPFNLGKLAPLVFVVAVLWSVVLCGILIWSDWLRVGVGMLVVIVLGFGIYALIPAVDRGRFGHKETAKFDA
ncbi:APC family permease [Rhodococcus opacus]|nr:APC family permease [Rhodococcus opacus]